MQRAIPLSIHVRGKEVISFKNLHAPAIIDHQMIHLADAEYGKSIVMTIAVGAKRIGDADIRLHADQFHLHRTACLPLPSVSASKAIDSPFSLLAPDLPTTRPHHF